MNISPTMNSAQVPYPLFSNGLWHYRLDLFFDYYLHLYLLVVDGVENKAILQK